MSADRTERCWPADDPPARGIQSMPTPSVLQAAAAAATIVAAAGAPAAAAIAAAAGAPPTSQADDLGSGAKEFATAQARAALKGFELVAMPGGGFVSSQWGHIRALATMDEVAAFLKQIGA